MHQSQSISSNRRPIAFAAIGFLLGAALALAGLTLTSATGNSDAVVTVNGEAISREAFFERLELAAGEDVLEEMIIELLVAQAIDRYDDVELTDEEVQAELDLIKASHGSEEAFLDTLARLNLTLEEVERHTRLSLFLDKLTRRGIEVSEEEIEAYYNQNRATLSTPERVQVRHILVDTKEQAEELRAQLVDGADFEELAKAHSTDTASAVNGGMIGYLQADSPIVPAFKEAALKLQVGEVSQPVQTEFGWHLIRADDRIEATDPTLDEARDLIRDILIDQKARPVNDVLYDLWMESVVEVHWPRYDYFANDPEAELKEGSEE